VTTLTHYSTLYFQPPLGLQEQKLWTGTRFIYEKVDWVKEAFAEGFSPLTCSRKSGDPNPFQKRLSTAKLGYDLRFLLRLHPFLLQKQEKEGLGLMRAAPRKPPLISHVCPEPHSRPSTRGFKGCLKDPSTRGQLGNFVYASGPVT